jgi:hypothetical protein
MASLVGELSPEPATAPTNAHQQVRRRIAGGREQGGALVAAVARQHQAQSAMRHEEAHARYAQPPPS